MNILREMKQNQHRIVQLARSMSLWFGTPHAQNPGVRARINELQERTMHHLHELEIEGQKVKIASMEAVVNLLKEGAETPVI